MVVAPQSDLFDCTGISVVATLCWCDGIWISRSSEIVTRLWSDSDVDVGGVTDTFSPTAQKICRFSGVSRSTPEIYWSPNHLTTSSLLFLSYGAEKWRENFMMSPCKRPLTFWLQNGNTKEFNPADISVRFCGNKCLDTWVMTKNEINLSWRLTAINFMNHFTAMAIRAKND